MPDENLKPLEKYRTKLIKHAARSTWDFSKAQVIFSFAIALASAPISYYFGLAPSILYGLLAVFCVNVGALLIIAFYNFLFRAPAEIHRKQQEEIAKLKQQFPTPAEQIPAPEPQPNIVCTLAGFTQVDIDGDYDIVQRGWNHIAVAAEFVNQPELGRRIKSERYVMARITYFDADGRQVQRINHGTWMDEEWQCVEFGIGDTRRLILALQPIEGEEYMPAMDVLRAIENNHESTERYNEPDYKYLPANVARAEVQLFSGNNGAILGNFTFQLNLTQEPPVTIV